MNELVLKYAWQHRCYNTSELRTTNNQRLVIHRTGLENTDSGPDFHLAEITIGETKWVGNVEIHVNSSDWELHNHHHDKAYNNVILHVVFNHDKEIKIHNSFIPTLELNTCLRTDFLAQYDQIYQYKGTSIPCSSQLKQVDTFHINNWLNRLLVERMQDRSSQIQFLFESTNNNITETLYQWVAIGFGLKVNKDAFLLLSRYIPYQLIQKTKSNKIALEALLFGMSGLLPNRHSDPYVKELISEFAFLKVKHSLVPMNREAWKFLRMRPVNFPTIKIAQLCAVLLEFDNLFEILNASPDRLNEAIEKYLNPFWDNHYSFDASQHKRHKTIGDIGQRHLLLNIIQPFKLFVTRLQGDEITQEIDDWFIDVPAEENKITRKMVKAGFMNKNSSNSQALIQLHNLYCEQKRCLKCAIGHQILQVSASSKLS